MYPRDEMSLCSLECYVGVYFPRRFATRFAKIKYQNNLMVRAETIRHSGTYIFLYLSIPILQWFNSEI